jgi:hypothetical protein
MESSEEAVIVDVDCGHDGAANTVTVISRYCFFNYCLLTNYFLIKDRCSAISQAIIYCTALLLRQ